jgi:hypothetical protein
MPADVESELARLGAVWSETVAHVDVAEVLERSMVARSHPEDDVALVPPTNEDRMRAEAHSRWLGQRWMIAAACAALVVAGVVAVGQWQAGAPEPSPLNPAIAPSSPIDSVAPPTSNVATTSSVPIDRVAPTPTRSPFVGAWQSTDPDGSSHTMDIEQWDTDEYFTVLNVEDVACPSGDYQVNGTGRPLTETSLRIGRPRAYCWDAQGFSPPVPDPDAITLDLSIATGELVGSDGVVWRRLELPPLDPDDTLLLEAFLDARLAGGGAEHYLISEAVSVPPLMYATTEGIAYERYEIEPVLGYPLTPPGTPTVEVRLFAEDGTIVAQVFGVVARDGQRGLEYGREWDDMPTTENWRPVPVPFGILDGEVTFAAAPPWRIDIEASEASTIFQKSGWNLAWFVAAAEPLAVGSACENAPAPTDARSVVQSIVADPRNQVTEAVPVRIAGIDGLRIDVTTGEGRLCAWSSDGLSGYQGNPGRVRLYVVDLPGESVDVLTFAYWAGPDEWDDAIDDIGPIVDSIRFQLN